MSARTNHSLTLAGLSVSKGNSILYYEVTLKHSGDSQSLKTFKSTASMPCEATFGQLLPNAKFRMEVRACINEQTCSDVAAFETSTLPSRKFFSLLFIEIT